MSFHPLLRHHALISDQVDQTEVSIVLAALEKLLAAGRRGAIVEFGCYIGTTSLFIRRLLDQYAVEGSFHVYDSFAGLPDKTSQDISVAGEQFQKGQLAATKKQFLQQFYRAHLKAPIVHKAWFGDLTASDVPDGVIFAFLDGDYYQSIRDSLQLITPKLAPGAVIIVDDYAHEALPGAARAVDEWCRGRNVTLSVEASLAIIVTA